MLVIRDWYSVATMPTLWNERITRSSLADVNNTIHVNKATPINNINGKCRIKQAKEVLLVKPVIKASFYENRYLCPQRQTHRHGHGHGNPISSKKTMYHFISLSYEHVHTGEAEQGGKRGDHPPKLSNMYTVQYILDAELVYASVCLKFAPPNGKLPEQPLHSLCTLHLYW